MYIYPRLSPEDRLRIGHRLKSTVTHLFYGSNLITRVDRYFHEFSLFDYGACMTLNPNKIDVESK